MKFLDLITERFVIGKMSAKQYYDTLVELEQTAYLELKAVQQAKEKVFKSDILPTLIAGGEDE